MKYILEYKTNKNVIEAIYHIIGNDAKEIKTKEELHEAMESARNCGGKLAKNYIGLFFSDDESKLWISKLSKKELEIHSNYEKKADEFLNKIKMDKNFSKLVNKHVHTITIEDTDDNIRKLLELIEENFF